MKSLIAILAIVVMVGSSTFGCVRNSLPIKTTELPIQPAVQPQTQDATQPTTIDAGQMPPSNRTWMSPGKVQIGNFYPSARAEWNISIHNGNDVATEFEVKYREPSYTAEGYAKPMAGTKDWVIIADATPVIAARGTKDILVVVAMPKDVKNYPLKMEFWISVMEKAQQGMVKTELCSRWQIVMR